MKLASYRVNNINSFGIVTDEGIIDLPSRLDGDIADLKALLQSELSGLDKIASESQPDYTLDQVSLLPVIPNPDAIFCMGMNTYSHCEEVKAISGKDAVPKKPQLFMRMARTQVGHGQALEKPNGTPLFDYEGEIAIVIGKKGRHISQEDALDYIAGYSCYNDGSMRDYQFHSPMFTAGKNFTRSAGFGPWLVTADEIGSPDSMHLTTRVNGDVVQEMAYDDLIFSFPEIISYISEFTELYPGDVIVTGAAAGVGVFRQPQLWLQDSDTCEVEVTGIGTLVNPVADAQGENRAPVTRTDALEVFMEAIEYVKGH